MSNGDSEDPPARTHQGVRCHVAALARLCVASLALIGAAHADAPQILGDWATPTGATIRIEPCGAAPCGKIVNFRPLPGHTVSNTRDELNRDRSKRHRKVLDLKVLWKLKPAGDSWKGRVYDPRRGFSVGVTLEQKSQTGLLVTGCARVIFKICEKETWRRVN